MAGKQDGCPDNLWLILDCLTNILSYVNAKSDGRNKQWEVLRKIGKRPARI